MQTSTWHSQNKIDYFKLFFYFKPVAYHADIFVRLGVEPQGSRDGRNHESHESVGCQNRSRHTTQMIWFPVQPQPEISIYLSQICTLFTTAN